MGEPNRGPQASAVAAISGELVVSDCRLQCADLNGLWVARSAEVAVHSNTFFCNEIQGICVNLGGAVSKLENNRFIGNGRRPGTSTSTFVDAWQDARSVSTGVNDADRD